MSVCTRVLHWEEWGAKWGNQSIDWLREENLFFVFFVGVRLSLCAICCNGLLSINVPIVCFDKPSEDTYIFIYTYYQINPQIKECIKYWSASNFLSFGCCRWWFCFYLQLIINLFPQQRFSHLTKLITFPSCGGVWCLMKAFPVLVCPFINRFRERSADCCLFRSRIHCYAIAK